ncbi:FR47-like protein [Thermasporomyces composti]|jgi:GNAT superfamily N-acetyltransferase|uniref:FR47-like protein n=2 Tax=Thermasporomyces composti TaxID=696763 RepID=A0A3D9V5R5_THECX|nr:FR47-like protein [Thermasporomyces composti]
MLAGMRCEITSDPGEFWATTADFLLTDPVLNNVILVNVDARRSGTITDPAPASYLTVRDGSGAVVGAAMRTPPYPVYVSRLPAAAIEPVLDALLEACPDAAGLTGTVAEADALAPAWGRRTGRPVEVEMDGRIYRLDEVTPPARVSGTMRRAGPADLDLLLAWTVAFHREATPPAAREAGPEPIEMWRRELERKVAEGRVFLWDDAGPVSYAGTSRPVADVVRVAPVYTPPEHRRRGYASALVAAVSQAALDEGAVATMLYTDLANPTSNKIYAAVGYRPVADVRTYRFGRPATDAIPPSQNRAS